ncbi:hypothetical protein GCM10027589_56150 [Actinocorallia lasiicapitis]
MRYAELYRRLRTGQGVTAWAAEVLRSAATGGLGGVRHPLGFLCLPVERSGPRGVCVHIWSPELPPAQAETSGWHCHSWELTSFVLYGGLRNELAAVSPGADYRIFEVDSGAGADELRATPETVAVIPVEGATVTGGETYTLAAGIYHRSLPAGETATVALGSDDARARDLSLGPLGLGSHRFVRDPSPAAETAGIALRAAELLDAETAGKIRTPKADL